MNNKNIIIIGMAGVGKSTVGRLLSIRLNVPFIDLDVQIEENCGVNIATIFSIEGEAGFRLRETSELKKVMLNMGPYILSVGGGLVINSENQSILASSSNHIIIQLVATPLFIIERLNKSANKRPLLAGNDFKNKIKNMYDMRSKIYDQVSHIKIDTDNLKPSQVVARIVEILS